MDNETNDRYPYNDMKCHIYSGTINLIMDMVQIRYRYKIQKSIQDDQPIFE